MRKSSIIIRCDNTACKEVAEVSEIRETPEGWYHVQQADEHLKLPPNGGWDFYSLSCVKVWADNRRKALSENRSYNPEATESEGDRKHRSQTTVEKELREVIQLLQEEHGEFTSRQIEEITGISQGTVSRYLLTWLDNGDLRVTHSGSGHKSDPRRLCLSEGAWEPSRVS